MAKVTRLSLHKNTLERRQKRERSEGVAAEIRRSIRDLDVRAYAFVAIGASGKSYACWDTGSIMPMRAFPEVVAGILRDDVLQNEDLEDWKPPIVSPDIG